MKKLFKKTKGLVKGTPVAVLVSIGIHGVLLFAALGWVVFTVVKKDEVAFVPVEKLDRPKMKLRKLRVKVKQNSKPKQSTQRIVTKATRVISDIQLPEMSGVGEGLGDSIGGFSLMDDLSKMSLMGGGKSVGNDLVGTYYYLKQKRNGTPSGLSGQSGAADSGGAYMQLLQEFFKKGWDDSVFDPYWRAPTKLYATQMFVPPVPSTIAPEKFGDTRGYDAMPCFGWRITRDRLRTRPADASVSGVWRMTRCLCELPERLFWMHVGPVSVMSLIPDGGPLQRKIKNIKLLMQPSGSGTGSR